MMNAGKVRLNHPDSVSLEASPQRNMRMAVPGMSSSTSGYIPSSVYLRSSYRAKQYPTLSTGSSKTHTHRHSQFEPHSSAHASTLPSPYKNKFELNAGCDSPVGLYNCPQQRT